MSFSPTVRAGPNTKLGNHIHDTMLANSFTPDVVNLRDRFAFVPFFSYGTERFRYSNFDILQNMPRYGIGMTASPDFSMASHRIGQSINPVVMHETSKDISGNIHGEVFLVTPEIIMDLDQSYNNSVFFRRVRRAIYHYPPEQASAKHKNISYTVCNMYIGDVSFWQDKRKRGEIELLKMFTPNSAPDKPYYSFTFEDDKPNRNRKIPF